MEDIINELAAMVALDQKVRREWDKIRLDKMVDETILARVKDEWHHVDTRNLARLKAIFAEYGYPSTDRFEEKASHNFWLLLQHGDQEPMFQMEVLAAMEPLLKTRNINLGDYAYLYDRVRVNTDRLQRYGTQLKVKDDGSGYEPKPLEEPDLIDQRRSKMGLPPLAEYLTAHLSLFPIE